ncbi:unnamed protein product [Brachionus calyciflorus]|uniref:Uncharacterized protein n=1 Tax=Brachionus calyciflorus TaxID=104777 RepID=A0A814LPH2_9BILA|nr:unnamed protein product [Brachionus calyciflorus]
MNSELTRSDIINYYDNLINTIDTHSEKILNEKTFSDDEKSRLNDERLLIISKIKEIQKDNLKCLNQSPFCFFVPNKFNELKGSVNQYGKLIILSNQIDEDLVAKISEFIDREEYPDYYYFESYKDLLKFEVINKLIEIKFDNLIIDLSKPELNILKQLELDDTKRFKRIRLKSFKFLKKLINLSSVEYLKTSIYDMYPFPDYLELFPCLKNLEFDYAYFEFIPSKAFSCLKQLETLTIIRSEIQ